MFGGIGPKDIDGTWLWNGLQWDHPSPVTEPRLRYFAASVFDPVFGSVVMFGGASPDSNETWTWDGTNWVRLITGLSPYPRQSAGMAFDERRTETVMFGGLSNRRLLSDTWVLTPR
jgi:hypothetical protein